MENIIKNLLPLLYIALGMIWLAFNRTAESALTLFFIVVIYFIVSSFRKKSNEPEVVEDPEEFHNDFSKVGSADPNDEKISCCSSRMRVPPKR